MHYFLSGLSKKSILILKSFLLTALILSSMTSYAQVSKSELKQLQKESSLKIITFEIFGVNTKEDAAQLKTKVEFLKDVRDCEVDYQNNLCRIIAGFGVQKSDVLGITGRSAVKTSNYSEEVRWQTNQNSYKKIQYTDEKARAKELNYDPEEEEKMKQEMEMRRNVEREIAAKEKQQAINTSSDYALPKGYPRFQNSGNRVEDERKYAMAKEEWIKNNPDKYQLILAKDESDVTEINNAEFMKMSAEKQQVIKSNPAKYKIIK